MSFTESGRLAQVQAQARACAISTSIAKLQCCPPALQINRPVGNSESGRMAQAAADAACCRPAVANNNYTNCCPLPVIPATRTVQTEGAYTASRQAACAIVAETLTENMISAGGSSESQRLRRLQDEFRYPNYATNPDARFLQYQRFFPAPCPPAPVANNLPLTQPEFGCDQVNQFPYS
jgi:hypothetical protein